MARSVKLGFRLVAGYRRFLAAKKLGWKTIPAYVLKADDFEEIIVSLEENLRREDPDILLVAQAVHHLCVTSGFPPEKIAKKFKRSRQWVSNMHRIHRYSNLFREGVEAGFLKLQHCLEICVLHKADSMAQAIRFTKKVKPLVIDLRQYVKILQRVDEIKEALRKRPQDNREQLINELKALNIQLETFEGIKKRNSKFDRAKEIPCDCCSKNVLRRHIHAIRLCPSCYTKMYFQVIKKK